MTKSALNETQNEKKKKRKQNENLVHTLGRPVRHTDSLRAIAFSNVAIPAITSKDKQNTIKIPFKGENQRTGHVCE